MAVTAAWEAKLEEIREEYQRARKLIDSESLSDPPTEPYRSKYEAKKILKELLELVGQVETDSPRKELVRALVKYDLGTIATETDETSLGHECFEECLAIIGEERYEDPCFCSLAIGALNQLGVIASGRSDPTGAREFLKRAEAVYARVSAGDATRVRDPADCLLAQGQAARTESGPRNLERAHTHTLYYLAQVYESLGEAGMAAMYCHSTLKKQLAMGDLDSVDWAVNAATLSQFFIVRGDFGAGRHHLACASHVLQEYARQLDRDQSSPDQKKDKEETLKHRSADVARCWAKYGLLLLVASREEAANRENGAEDETPSKARSPHVLVRSPEVAALEAAVTDQLVMDFEGAKPVFLACQRWLTEAKEYYTLQNHATDYIEIVQESSKLYKELAHFEPAADRRCKMHKRRIDMLEEVLKEVNPRFYLHPCRQVMFELGETYGELMDTKFASLPAAVRPNSHAVKKINSLVDKAVRHFSAFLDTLREPDGQFPDSFADELARPALVAHFCVGRLHSKKVAQDPREQFANFEKTKVNYEFVQDYCRKVPEHAPLVKEELEVMAELLQLIPGTLQNMMSSTLY
ncbi:unnamed protein product [Ixodes hexagonus]